jgi:hypothetical protein
MEAMYSSEMSVNRQRTTRRYIPENIIQTTYINITLPQQLAKWYVKATSLPSVNDKWKQDEEDNWELFQGRVMLPPSMGHPIISPDIPKQRLKTHRKRGFGPRVMILSV